MYKQHRIPPSVVRLLTAVAAIAAAVVASGCGTADNASNALVSALSPYKMEVVQGNFVSKEQAVLILPGMSRNQVRTILGTPLLTDIFHPERWDYVFSIKRTGVEPIDRRFTVFFDGETVSRTEASGELLTEEEFVRHLDAVKEGQDEEEILPLEATPEQLEDAAKSAQAYRERLEQQNTGHSTTERPAGYYPPLDAN